MAIVTVLDPGYPELLRTVHDRPALIFLTGAVTAADTRSVAIIGARRASTEGRARAHSLSAALAADGFTIVSGLAAGIDTAAHTAALEHGARTIAVIGTGLHHAYPPENAGLQDRIGHDGAVVSQFWPEQEPDRGTFPQRNALMSGMAAGTVIVEAGVRSGARIQARRALAHGRPVFLDRALSRQDWARELAQRPGVTTFGSAGEIAARLDALADRATLTG